MTDSDATLSHQTPQPPTASPHSIATPPTATPASLLSALDYTVTVEQAREMFFSGKRRVPSGRTLQRYADEGKVPAMKIKTMFGNTPGSEWLFNEAAIRSYIDAQPVMAAPELTATAPKVEQEFVATPDDGEILPTATPKLADTDLNGTDSVANHLPEPIGERRRLSDVLIENARLVAQLEGKDAVISELRDDKMFLRDEVKENRTLRDYMKQISDKMLSTFESIAIESARARTDRDAAPMPARVIEDGTAHR